MTCWIYLTRLLSQKETEKKQPQDTIQEAKAFENSPWQRNVGDSHVPRAVQRETPSPEMLRNPSLQL